MSDFDRCGTVHGFHVLPFGSVCIGKIISLFSKGGRIRLWNLRRHIGA